MSSRYPNSVIQCFLHHTDHLKSLSKTDREFMDQYLGLSMTFIEMIQYLYVPATFSKSARVMSKFKSMENVDSFIQSHENVYPPILPHECSSLIFDKSYFIHRGWGGIALEENMNINLMTSFSFSKEIAQGFTDDGKVMTIKLTLDVLNNSLYIGEMAQVKTEEEIILFPGALTRVGKSNLYTYKPYPKDYTRNKIEDRRNQLEKALERVISVEEKKEREANEQNEHFQMKDEEMKGSIIHLYQSLRSKSNKSPLAVGIYNDDIKWSIMKKISGGKVVENLSVDQDGIIRGIIGEYPVRIIISLSSPDDSQCFIDIDGKEYQTNVMFFIFKGKHVFLN